jgi:hypothetical protein
LNEYRKYIEKDPALARRFQSVFVPEPTVQDTISILRGCTHLPVVNTLVDLRLSLSAELTRSCAASLP